MRASSLFSAQARYCVSICLYVPRQLGDPDFCVLLRCQRRQALFQQAELGLQVLFLGSQRRLVGGVLGGDRRDPGLRDSGSS